MKYEIDFIGIKEETCDADSICLRFFDEKLNRYVVGVYDGGIKKYGEALCEHLKTYYFQNEDNPVIDFVICSHPDEDHASGLSLLFDQFKIKNLIMNRPWLYIDELYDKVTDGRITKESLEKRLRDSFPFIDKLEELATECGTKISEGFEGTTISNRLKILSPSKDFYFDLLVESTKTPCVADTNIRESFIKKTFNLIETWTKELLKSDVKTSAENESSIVIYGDMDNEKFLLTGDAGIRALNNSIDYSESIGIDTKNIEIMQIPHHGGRHNVNSETLDRLIGKKVSEGTMPNKTAFVSVGTGTDHPKKMVTNAYLRRGVKVYEARSSTVHHQRGTPYRVGWGSIEAVDFCPNVENWD